MRLYQLATMRFGLIDWHGYKITSNPLTNNARRGLTRVESECKGYVRIHNGYITDTYSGSLVTGKMLPAYVAIKLILFLSPLFTAEDIRYFACII